MSGEHQHEIYRRRSARNLFVGGGLGLVVILIFAVTIVKLGENATNPFTEQFDPRLMDRDALGLGLRVSTEAAEQLQKAATKPE